MSKIQKFTIKGATITINSATKLQFNSDKCNSIESPFIICIAFQCKDYALLLELQGFDTDKVVEPTKQEIESSNFDYGNPYFIDCWHEFFDRLEIKKDSNNKLQLVGFLENDEPTIYKDGELERFHIYKVNGNSWTEVELNLRILHQQAFLKFEPFASGWINNFTKNEVDS